MTEPVFPTLPGLAWSVMKAPRFATRIQKAISGRELRVIDQVLPIWTYTLTYSVLRDDHDTRGIEGLGTGLDELRTLSGFFLRSQGQFGTFLFDDPTDDSVAGQAIGTGDGATTTFQLVRTFGGFMEPVTAPNVVSAVYFNGVLQSSSGYLVDPSTGLIVFTLAPGAGVSITADFTYYFRVRFTDDTAEFENFMFQLWSLKQIKFQSIIGPGAPQSGGATVSGISWEYITVPPVAGTPVLRYTFTQFVQTQPSLAGSVCTAINAATAITIFDIAKNGANFGTITFAASASFGTITGTTTSFTLGDVLTIIPRTSDATLSMLSGVIGTA